MYEMSGKNQHTATQTLLLLQTDNKAFAKNGRFFFHDTFKKANILIPFSHHRFVKQKVKNLLKLMILILGPFSGQIQCILRLFCM
jgi:hypothetical protein